MTSSAVTSRYAGALVDVVTGKAAPAEPHKLAEELRSFEETLRQSSDLRSVLASPAVPGSRKRAVIGAIADRLQISGIGRNFLLVLVDHRRLESLGDMIEHFEVLLDERLGYQRAEVTSADALEDAQRAVLRGQLESIAGKRIRVKYAVDENLIGGVIARVGSTVYDGSVRGQLRALERRMVAEA
jgi:F-type H+-transporting ATPase subunit delta